MKTDKAAHDANAKQERAAAKETARQSRGKKDDNPVIINQWAEITVEDGLVATRLSPPNEVVAKVCEKLQPDLVIRHFHFLNGVPDQYAWTTGDPEHRIIGGVANQRIEYATWKLLIAEEAADPAGLLHPTFNMPRPESSGGCDCQTCTQNRATLAARENRQ